MSTPHRIPSDWITTTASPEEVARERAKARELRASQWWKNQLAKGVCHYCGKHFPPSELTMDHVIPVARGGKSERGNVVPACRACNQGKRCLTPADQAMADIAHPLRRQEIVDACGRPAGTLLVSEGQCIAVDPVDADAILGAVAAMGLDLCAVFATRALDDAAVACDALHLGAGVPVIGPEESGDIELDRIVTDGETVHTPLGDFAVAVAADGSATFSPA